MKNTIKVERARNNMTQAELADKVKVSRQTINAIETGKFIPSTLLAFKIAHVLQVSIDAVFRLEDCDW
ncbi:helix-turn-helix transcriptional regulator [Rhodocytophaga aerolata]|uniref:Helix-turn-helix transcriptional regulator n=1 Tax=Rhodocytophaga aerolata TaxID=455078 RepID=A0ABT8REK5_9BACT|nr:helix-turn-helix transcriptional regulator [Rhodocytophaga aerolata]MDO1450546.1 helix-turn-helix transcriptional regulator [Rhodocytophaga aerolata]